MATINDTTPDAIATETCDTTPYYLNDGTTESLALAGSLIVTVKDINVNDESNDITLAQVTNDRFLSFNTKTPTYYIKVAHDINSEIGFNVGANDSTDDSLSNDDAWSMNAITLNSSTSTASEMLLPWADKTMTVARFTANDISGENREKTWDVELNIVLGNDGAISANASLSNSESFTGLAAENDQATQHAYWPGVDATPSEPTKGEGDILAATISSTQIESHFAANMSAVESDINDLNDVIDSWELQFSEIAFDPTSNLSQYGQANNRNSSSLFVSGARIVANSPALYAVEVVVDYNDNNNNTLLVNDYVYGILEQN
jgi:hypothetical protein